MSCQRAKRPRYRQLRITRPASRSTATRSLAARVPSPFAYVITRRGTRPNCNACTCISLCTCPGSKGYVSAGARFFSRCFTLHDPRGSTGWAACQLPDPINSIRLCIVIEGSRNRVNRAIVARRNFVRGGKPKMTRKPALFFPLEIYHLLSCLFETRAIDKT